MTRRLAVDTVAPVERGGVTLIVSPEMRTLYTAWRGGRALPPSASSLTIDADLSGRPEETVADVDGLDAGEPSAATAAPSWRALLAFERRSFRRDGQRPLRVEGATLLRAKIEDRGETHELEVFLSRDGALGFAAIFLPGEHEAASEVHTAALAQAAPDFRALLLGHDPGRAFPVALAAGGADPDEQRRGRARGGYCLLLERAGLSGRCLTQPK